MPRKQKWSYRDSDHTYRIGTMLVPSCTGALSLLSESVYKAIRADVLDRATAFGREVHRATHLSDGGTLDVDSVDPRVMPRLMSWLTFKEQTGFIPILSEFRHVGSIDQMPFGLTVDAAGTIDGQEVLVEKKNCTRLFPHHDLQTAGYAGGLPSFTKETKKIDDPLALFLARRRFVVRFTAKGVPQIRECTETADFFDFASQLRSTWWRWKHEKFYGKGSSDDERSECDDPSARI